MQIATTEISTPVFFESAGVCVASPAGIATLAAAGICKFQWRAGDVNPLIWSEVPADIGELAAPDRRSPLCFSDVSSKANNSSHSKPTYQFCTLIPAQQDQTPPKATEKTVPPSEIAKTLVDKVLADPQSPAMAWDAVLKTNTVTSDVLAEAVAILHTEKKYDFAVEAIQSGIRNNLAAAWMYDVLAMEMKLAKRPPQDIARVLQSRIDFTNADIPQLLITVALLSRFEAWDEAMGVCREATELDPQLPESWLLARSVADKSKNPEHRVWARCGILTHVWTDDSPALHDEARKVITEIAAELNAAGESPRAQAMRTQLREASSIDLMLILRWVGSADLDLMVTSPNGDVCSYRNRQTSQGGRFTHDDPGSPAEGGAKRYEQFICRAAADGEYTAAIRLVLGKVTGLPVLEIIHNAGTPEETRTTKTIKLSREDVKIAIPVKQK